MAKYPEIITFPRINDPRGNLSFIEGGAGGSVPFDIKRVFYLYDVPADAERGGHAHYSCQQLLIALSGSFNVKVTDGFTEKSFHLSRPWSGLLIPPGYWRTMDNFTSGAVCLVLTSERYSEEDYIRDYQDFLRLSAEGKLGSREDGESGSEEVGKMGSGGDVAVRYPFLDLGGINRPYLPEIEDAALRVIRSGRYIGGGEVERFEADLRAYTGAPYAVGVSNGLDALRLILRAWIELGRIAPGDEVIVPSNTYIASVLAITDNGLTPVFVEPDLATLNLDSAKVEAAVTPRTRAVMPVHLYGRVCWDATLASIVRRHNLLVIEDNAQAIGALSETPGLFGTIAAGSLGHAGAFSFYPTKNLGAMGDAGAVVTHDAELARVVAALRNYGSLRQYDNIYAGLNCRLDPMQAAILSAKMPHLAEENRARRATAAIYLSEIANPLVSLPAPAVAETSVWHQFVVRVADRDAFRAYLAANGVETAVHYATVPHRQPCYSRYSSLSLPIAERIGREVVSLPVSSCTSEADAKAIAGIVNGFKDS